MLKHTRRIGLIATLLVAVWVGHAAAAQTYSLVIGVDGLGYGDHGLLVADTPVIDSIRDGSWAEGYRTAYAEFAYAGGVLDTPTQQPTISGPGWSTILTGVWTDRHGVTDNGFGGADFENNPSYLETLEQAVPNIVTVSIVHWQPIDRHIIETVDDVDTRMDVRETRGDDLNVAILAQDAVAHLPHDQPGVVFVHFDEVDDAGHQHGGDSEGYLNAIKAADYYIGMVLSALPRRDHFADEDWQIIIVSDHGHTPAGGHGGQSELERRIPFYVCSKNLRPGALDSADNRTVSHADVAPTVLAHFGVDIPEHYAGVSHADGVPADE